MKIGVCASILAFLVIFTSAPTIAQTALRIAAVDTEKSLEESIWGKKAIEELGKEREEWRKKAEQLNKEITDLEEDLAKRRTFLDNKEEEQKLQAVIDDKKQSLELLIQQGNVRLAERQEELLAPILEDMKNVINRLSVDEGYDLVLEKRLIVLYLNPEYDLTNRVAVMLDELYKEKVTSKSGDSEEPKTGETGEKDTQ